MMLERKQCSYQFLQDYNLFVKKIFITLVFLLHLAWMRDIDPKINSFRVNNTNRTLDDVIGIMVDFQEDDDPETSGNGKFLTDINSNLKYIDYPNIYRQKTIIKSYK